MVHIRSIRHWPIPLLLVFCAVALSLATNDLKHSASAQRPILDLEYGVEHSRSISISVEKAAARVLPSVVIIKAFTGPAVTIEWASRIREIKAGAPPVEDGYQRTGTGLIVDPDGIVVTNEHLIKGADAVVVQLTDGTTFMAGEISSDPYSDLAIIRLQKAHNLPAATLADPHNLSIGDFVFTIGHPFGLKSSISLGIISAKELNVAHTRVPLLQMDAASNPGNSGGPLVNLSGEVVGITEGAFSLSGGFEGVALAIPSDAVKRVTRELIGTGTVRRPHLGVESQELSPQLAIALALPPKAQGLVLTRIPVGTSAAAHEFQVGDVITNVSGMAIQCHKHLEDALAMGSIGEPVEIAFWRDGQQRVTQVRLGELSKAPVVAQQSTGPSRPQFSDDQNELGFDVVAASPAELLELGYVEPDAGVLVTHVDPHKSAYRKGIQAGMLILQVGKSRVRTVEQFDVAIGRSSLRKGILILVSSPQGRSFEVFGL